MNAKAEPAPEDHSGLLHDLYYHIEDGAPVLDKPDADR